MSTPLSHRSTEEIAREIVKPLEEQLSRVDEVLQTMDVLIREAEKKSTAVIHPPEP